MWTFTVVAVAKPRIFLGVALASKTCYISTEIVECPGIGVSSNNSTPSNRMLKVCVAALVFTTTMLVTTVVVPVVGTVYRSPTVVANVALARALVVVAINYYFLLLLFLFLVSTHDYKYINALGWCYPFGVVVSIRCLS